MKVCSLIFLLGSVGISFFVWGGDISSLLDAKYQLQLLGAQDGVETQSKEQEIATTLEECITKIGEYAKTYPAYQDAFEDLVVAWSKSTISTSDTGAMNACNAILRNIIIKDEIQRKIGAHRQIQDLYTQIQKIDFQYQSIAMTPRLQEVIKSLDEIVPNILEGGEFGSHDARQWEETKDVLASVTTGVFEDYNKDFSDVLARDDSRFLDEMDKHFALGSAPPLPPEAGLKQLILIDLSDQMLYAYEDKYLVKSTYITSGQKKYPTQPGTYEVLEKKNGKWMNSPFPNDYYRLWVDYWIRFSWGGYGIHDTCNAKNCWRTEYGVENYTWAGSHGCINTPYEVVKDLYHWADIGTKVIVRE